MLEERSYKYKNGNRLRCDDIPSHSHGSVFDSFQFPRLNEEINTNLTIQSVSCYLQFSCCTSKKR